MAVLTLTKPIDAHGETIASIDIGKPTSKDIMDLGYPLNINPDCSFNFRMDVVGRYVSRLGKIPMSSVERMDVADLQAAAMEIAGFFSPGA